MPLYVTVLDGFIFQEFVHLPSSTCVNSQHVCCAESSSVFHVPSHCREIIHIIIIIMACFHYLLTPGSPYKNSKGSEAQAFFPSCPGPEVWSKNLPSVSNFYTIPWKLNCKSVQSDLLSIQMDYIQGLCIPKPWSETSETSVEPKIPNISVLNTWTLILRLGTLKDLKRGTKAAVFCVDVQAGIIPVQFTCIINKITLTMLSLGLHGRWWLNDNL